MPSPWSFRRSRNRSGPVLAGGRVWVPGFLRRYAAAFRDPAVAWWKKGGLVLAGLAVFGALCVFAVFLYALALIPSTPSALELNRAAEARPSVVLAAGGEKLTQFEDPFEEWVPLDSIPAHVVQALLATEDRRFYAHGGVDVRRSVAAGFRTLTGDTQGGSTVTQQLARNLFPEQIGRSGTVTRKLKEIIAALKIEQHHTKRDILEAYLNTIPYIYNATGIERAAQTYFGKPASALSVEEGATLVAMLKGTAYFDPARHPERARERRNLVLRLMADQGFLGAAEADSLRETALGLRFERLPGNASLAPHFTAAVRARMEGWAARRGYDLERDGLVIHTTLDLGLQQEAVEAVRAQTARLQAIADVEWSRRAMPSLGSADAYVAYRDRVEPFGYFWRTHEDVVERHVRRAGAFEALTEAGLSEAAALDSLRADTAFMDSLRAVATRLEAGFVAVEPASGDVKAWVGSRDFAVDEYDHVAVAQRQPGSTFKPFVYAAALQRGFSPLDRLTDEAVEVDLGHGRVWRPTNSGSVSGAAFTLADGLAYSKNTITVQLMAEVGPGRVAGLAREMGVSDSALDVVPSLALGTSPVTLLEMVSAYGTIANDGRRRVPRLVTRVETAGGRVLEVFGGRGAQALSRRVARTLLDMMRGVVDRGTGRGIRAWGVSGDLAGKTGTTQHNADGWFILMHPKLVAGAWVGFNDQQVAFRSNYWGQGAHNALFLVGDFFSDVQGRLGDARFPDPPRYRQPLDLDYDTLYTDVDAYFDREPLAGMDRDSFRHTEFDLRAYEQTFGRMEEDRPEVNPEERLRRASFADAPEEDPKEEARDAAREAERDPFLTSEEMLGEDEEEAPRRDREMQDRRQDGRNPQGRSPRDGEQERQSPQDRGQGQDAGNALPPPPPAPPPRDDEVGGDDG